MKILILLFATIFSAKAVTFNCTFETGWLLNIGNVYTCTAIISNINDENRNLHAVHGFHQSGKTNADVKLLDILDQPSVTFIAKGIEKFFSNLIAIYFGSTNISTLNGDELEAFGDLESFGMTRNPHLERIPGNFFISNPKIQLVAFSYNNIKHVGEDLFNGIEGNLKGLYFDGNYCVNRYASNTAAISSLIQHIKTNCSDIEQETTSTTLTTTSVSETSTSTTTSAPSCGEMSEIVCTLKDQNQILIENNEELKEELGEMRSENSEMKEEIGELSGEIGELRGEIQSLATDNEELKEKLEEISTENAEIGQQLSELSQENAEMKKMLNEVLEGIVELSTRPCG